MIRRLERTLTEKEEVALLKATRPKPDSGSRVSCEENPLVLPPWLTIFFPR